MPSAAARTIECDRRELRSFRLVFALSTRSAQTASLRASQTLDDAIADRSSGRTVESRIDEMAAIACLRAPAGPSRLLCVSLRTASRIRAASTATDASAEDEASAQLMATLRTRLKESMRLRDACVRRSSPEG